MSKIPEGSCACVRNPRNKVYYLICREKGDKTPTISGNAHRKTRGNTK